MSRNRISTKLSRMEIKAENAYLWSMTTPVERPDKLWDVIYDEGFHNQTRPLCRTHDEYQTEVAAMRYMLLSGIMESWYSQSNPVSNQQLGLFEMTTEG